MKALTEILFKIHEINKLTERGRLLKSIVEMIAELQRFPTANDIKFLSKKNKNFADLESINSLGNHEEIVAAVTEFCIQFNLSELLLYCAIKTSSGKVYLYKAGKYYKIGRTNDINRRDIEIKLQLPFEAKLIHSIETSDPVGIESYWHNLFKPRRQNGEWFLLSEMDVDLFKS